MAERMVTDLYNTTFQHALIQYHKRNPGWGNLHIVLEDGNLEDHHVMWCAHFAATEKYDYEGAGLAVAIYGLSLEEREKLYEMDL